MKTVVSAAILLLLTAACGRVPGNPTSALTSPSPSATPITSASPIGSPTATPTAAPSSKPNPQATPHPSPTLLFGVLEAKGTANSWTYNTVAIAGLDGYARAKATFTPMPNPVVGCMGPILRPSAHVAAGKVFFADAKGVVRSMASNGTVTTVATFPMTSTQQMFSFAVSPDGSRVLAGIFTIPKNAFSCDGSPTTGSFTYDAYTALSGQPSSLVYHLSWSTAPSSVMELTGWDALGPFGTYPTVWASQGGGPGSDLGVFVRIDATTLKPGAQFSDPSKCTVWDSVQSGAFVCLGDGKATSTDPYGPIAQPVSVRDAAGQE